MLDDKEKIKKTVDELFKRFDFTDREKDIIQLLMDGKSRKGIEEELFISPHTVKNNIYSIYQKLGVKNRLQIINLILKNEIPSGNRDNRAYRKLDKTI